MKTLIYHKAVFLALFSLMPVFAAAAQGEARPEIITVSGLYVNGILHQALSQDALPSSAVYSPDNADFHDHVATALQGIVANVHRFHWDRDWNNTGRYVQLLADEIRTKAELTKRSGAPLIIIAHNWGSVLAYGAVVTLQNQGYDPQIDLLITSGSPLGAYYSLDMLLESSNAQTKNSFRKMIAHNVEAGLQQAGLRPGKSALSVKKWVNIWAFGDMFSGPVSTTIDGVFDYRVDKESGSADVKKLGFYSDITGLDDDAAFKNNTYDNSELISLVRTVVIAVSTNSWNAAIENQFVEEKPLLTLIIDSSGSMSSTDPQGMRLKGINYLLELLTPALWNVLVVDFDNNAAIINRDNWTNWSRESLQKQVNRIDADGGTDIGGSLDAARAEFERLEGRVNFRESSVILLTDGVGDYDDQAAWFTEEGIEIHTISFIGNTNQVLLQQIADETSGTYNKAKSTTELTQKISKLYSVLSGQSLIKKHLARIQAGESISLPFFVSSFESALQVRSIWEKSEITLKVVSPRGITYPSSSDQVIQGNNYKIVMIDNPEPGMWEARLTGSAKTAAGGEEYTFEVAAESDFDLYVSRSKVNEKGIQFALEGRSKNKAALDSAFAQVAVPDGKVVPLKPNWAEGRLTFIPRYGAGNYEFDFRLNFSAGEGNDIIQRAYSHSVVVGEDQPFHIAPVTSTTGSYLFASLGANIGNFPGLTCTVYRSDPAANTVVARGIVTRVYEQHCQITLRRVFLNVAPGDVVELDLDQWMSD